MQGNKISEDCVLLFDEMYLQKGVQYQGGKYIGANLDKDSIVTHAWVI